MFRIEREALIEEVLTGLNPGRVLISGAPGIGKSWLVSVVARRLEKEGKDILLLAAENYPVNSLAELQKALGFKNDLLSILAGFGDGAMLILDGIDALRSEESQAVFRRLIRQVAQQVPRCSILASVRTFDLQQSDELQQLFQTHEFKSVQVRPLSKSELFQVTSHKPRLGDLLAEVQRPVRELLSNPYMLRLAIQLIEEGVPEEEILRAETEVELLSKYWNRRVETRDDGHLRQILLRKVVTQMSEEYTLSIAVSSLDQTIVSKNLGMTYHELKSDELLRESPNGRLFFEHAILFDYACARLLFTDVDVEQVVSSDPARAIFLRPAMSYFFQYLWLKSQHEFWTIVLQLFDPAKGYPERASIIPAVTIFESARTVGQLSPLLKNTGPTERRGLHNVLRAVESFNAFGRSRRQLWLDVLEHLVENPAISFINELLSALSNAYNTPALTLKQSQQVGKIARKLLLWGWSHASTLSPPLAVNLSGVLAARVLPICISLFGTAPRATREIVDKVLLRLNMPDADSHEAFWLVKEMKAIIDNDPKCAYKVYATLFGYDEKREESTQLGGQILRLTSNRKQDFSTALYSLMQWYPYFVKKSPIWATRAAIDAVNAEVTSEHLAKSSEENPHQFRFKYLATAATYTADYSEIWDQSHGRDESLGLLGHLLANVFNPPDSKDVHEKLVGILFREVAKRNRVAVVWKRILEYPVKRYEFTAKYIYPLLTIPQFLAAPEVVVPVGQTIEELYKTDLLTRRQCKRIEAAILLVPESSIIERYERPAALRIRLLARIPIDRLTSDESRELLAQLKTNGEESENKPYHRSSFYQRTLTDEDWLREQGAKTDVPAVKAILEASQPLRTFQSRFLNDTPSIEESLALESSLLAVIEMLNDQQLDPVVEQSVSGILASALQAVAKNRELPETSSLMLLTKRELLRLSLHLSPKPSPPSPEEFDKPIWGSPLARIEAAQGIMRLLWNGKFDSELEEAIHRLAVDPVPAVRFQVASNLAALYEHHRLEFWALVDTFLKEESTSGVVGGVVSQLAMIAGREPDAVVARFRVVIERGQASEDNDYVFGPIASSLAGLAAYLGTESAIEQIKSYAKDALKHPSTLSRIISYLNSQILEAHDKGVKEEVRTRAINLIIDIALKLNVILDAIVGETPFRPEQYASILRLTDSIAFRILLGLDADADLRDTKSALSDEEQRFYFSEYLPIIEILLSSRSDGRPHLAASAAYNLMKVFNTVLKYEPETTLSLAAKTCRAAAQLGYQYDSMAIGETVKLIEKTLADHYELLRKSKVATDVTEILDIFVRAGWPQAVQLVMRLDLALR